ncbi:MAG: acetolactate synthase large subunit, partial [Bacteroidales bacterium]|nr:acetolactate synthase large subunit [Bacteroidales bacterium]
GVCMVTSGPGATNLITGVATAYMDSIPMVAITGQVQSYLLGISGKRGEAKKISLPRELVVWEKEKE